MAQLADPRRVERPSPEPHEDGRTERTRRTRAAIIEAHLALLSDGELRPTAQQIAERSGVSVRTLWIHFSDMEGIYAATAETVLAAQRAAYRPVPVELPLEKRIDRFCKQRARLLEQLSPYAYASQLREPVSPMLQRYRAKHVQRVAREVEVVFARELDAVTAAGGARQDIVHAVAVVSTWGSWSVLRQHLGLSVTRSRKVMARAVSALLADALVPHALASPHPTPGPSRPLQEMP